MEVSLVVVYKYSCCMESSCPIRASTNAVPGIYLLGAVHKVCHAPEGGRGSEKV